MSGWRKNDAGPHDRPLNEKNTVTMNRFAELANRILLENAQNLRDLDPCVDYEKYIFKMRKTVEIMRASEERAIGRSETVQEAFLHWIQEARALATCRIGNVTVLGRDLHVEVEPSSEFVTDEFGIMPETADQHHAILLKQTSPILQNLCFILHKFVPDSLDRGVVLDVLCRCMNVHEEDDDDDEDELHRAGTVSVSMGSVRDVQDLDTTMPNLAFQQKARYRVMKKKQKFGHAHRLFREGEVRHFLTCSYCQKSELDLRVRMQLCGPCKAGGVKVPYCPKPAKCQKKHWKLHKRVCCSRKNQKNQKNHEA